MAHLCDECVDLGAVLPHEPLHSLAVPLSRRGTRLLVHDQPGPLLSRARLRLEVKQALLHEVVPRYLEALLQLLPGHLLVDRVICEPRHTPDLSDRASLAGVHPRHVLEQVFELLGGLSTEVFPISFVVHVVELPVPLVLEGGLLEGVAAHHRLEEETAYSEDIALIEAASLEAGVVHLGGIEVQRPKLLGGLAPLLGREGTRLAETAAAPEVNELDVDSSGQ